MNREVEERIVAMYFDNKDFEENARTTIDTLGQLRNSLDFGKEAEKGFSIFEKLGKTLNFDKANQSLNKMRNTLSGMKNVFKKVFNLGPLDDAYRALDNFKSKYFDRVLGFDIANKLVSSLENTFRQLSIAPISAGWNQYESKMDSVKTIMSSTGESMEVVENHLRSMTEYANKTIYSLTDMTSNLGKFTNNGVKLNDAVKAMEGIANATADAGQGSQSASMAMYNISQAMGVGKMTTIDWKSLENANIATIKLKETFLDMAAAQGRLRKETKKVGDEIKTSYWLETDEEGKKLKKAVELNASNFREYLSKGWLDKETMLRTFMLYSGEGVDQNTLLSWGIKDEEEQKRLLKIGEEAMEAATQVRTFTKMMDALKESVQSGWADSFQIIFGNMEQGTQLWTRINDKIDGVLSNITKKRNEALKEWAETDENGQSIWTKDANNNTVLREGAKGGRDILIDALFEIMDVVQDLGSALSETFGNVFGKLDGKKLLQLTIQFRDFVKRIHEWLGSMKDGNSRIAKLMKGLSGILNIIKVVGRVLKVAVGWLKSKLSPVVDWVIDKFSKFGDYFSNTFGNMKLEKIPAYLGKVVNDLWNKIKAVFTSKDGKSDSPFVGWIKNVWNGFKSAIHDFADKLGLTGVVDAVSNAWDTITGWPGWQAIGNFFSDVWKWIEETAGVVINWFQPGPNGEDSGFVKFIHDIAGAISSIWGTISNWEGWQAIGSFFSDIWVWITGKAQDALGWFQPGPDGEDSGFVKFIHDIAGAISSIWGTVSTWEGWQAIGSFFSDIWVWITGKTQDALSWFKAGNEGTDSGFVTFLKNLKQSVVDAWNGIRGWEGWSEIGNFFSNVWKWIMSFVNGGDSGDQGKASKKQGVIAQIEEKAEETKKAVKPTEEAVGFFERIITAIGDFFGKVKDTVGSVVIPEEITRFMTAAGDFFKGIFKWLTDILQSIGDIFNGKGDLSDWTAVVIPGLVILVGQIVEFFNNKHLAGIGDTQNFAQKFMEIAGGMLMMAGAVALLTTIDPGKMWSAVGAMAVLGAVVGVVTGIIAKMKVNSVQDAPVTSTERILNNLISTVGKIGIVFVAMKELPAIIETIGNVKKNLNGAEIGNDVLNAMLGLSALIASVSVVFAVVQKMTGNQGIDPGATVKTVLSLLTALGLIILGFTAAGGLLSLFGDKAPEDVAKMVDGLAKVLRSVGGAIGGFFASLFGGGTSTQKADETVQTLDKLSEAAQIFDNEKVSGISRMMTLIKDLTNQSESIDPHKLDGFAEAMGKLGAGIIEYTRFLTQDKYMLAFADLQDPTSELYQRLKGFNELAQNLGEMLTVYANLHSNDALDTIDNLAKEDKLKNLVTNLNTILSGLGDLKDPNSGINFDGLTIAKKLVEAIQDGLIDPKMPKFDATSIVDGIVEAIGLGNSAIALAVHNMVQEGLQLSGSKEGAGEFNLNGEASGLLEGLMQNGGDLNSLFNMDALKEQFYGKDGQSGILGEINALGDKIPSIGSMFEGKGWMDFKDEDGKEIDLLSEVQSHLISLGTTLSGMEPLKITITPVLNYENLTPEAIQKELDNRPLTLGVGADTTKMTIDFTGLYQELNLDTIQRRLEELVSTVSITGGNNASAIAALAGHIDGIATEVARLKLYLDTGALVGGITPLVDKELNRQALIKERTGNG